MRGLDYYTRTAFEFYPRGAEGQQSALGGGGRYDGLVELLGGRPTPGIGFALGLDRVVLALESAAVAPPPEPGPLAVVVGADPGRDRRAPAGRRRCCGRRASGRGPTSASASSAASSRAPRATAPTSRSSSATSWPTGDVQLRDLEAGTQRPVPLADLVRELRRADASHRHGEAAQR